MGHIAPNGIIRLMRGDSFSTPIQINLGTKLNPNYYHLKAGDKFAICAIEDGTVLEVTDKSITVEYKTKGKKTYLMNSWTSKEESGGCYTHHMATLFKPKEKFLKEDEGKKN